jgi:hypothetical protein
MWRALILVLALAATARAEPPVDFEREVAPIFLRRCLECHSAGEAKGSLVLIDRASALRGGDSGEVIVPGSPDESEIISRVTAGEMPPPKNDEPRKLADAEIAILRRWIAAGVPWPEGRRLDPYERTTDSRAGLDWWSLQPVRRPSPPRENSAWQRNPVDAYIQSKLTAAAMTPVPEADRRILIRRLSFDLAGLPPTFDEIEAFVADASPDAYERLVDRLLTSPQFGERWGRHWLDVVRYADTNGYERDAPKPLAWKYRDWVIAAISADMPYDRFVVEQLAGDEIPDRSEKSVIATGFARLGTWDDEPNEPAAYQYERLEDLVHTTSTAFLGLTVKCARCHDHKFDPVPQKDYYRVASVFWAGFIEPRDRALNGGPSYKELGFEALGWTDKGRDVPDLRLLKKGEHVHPLDVVQPAAPSFSPRLARDWSPPPADAKTTTRRLQLARWFVDPKNPLTPRVIVNRLWQHHFGQALVRTPNDFGFNGDRPSHPELLDWLAAELVSGEWRLKPLHREMVTSATYRQSSDTRPESKIQNPKSKIDDSDNRLLARMTRRRLEAEAIRDAMLAVTGELDPRMGGPGFFESLPPEALEGLSRKASAWQSSPPAERARRSVYMFVQRSLMAPLMTTLDLCDSTQTCGKRDVTTVAPQALALLNNPFVHARSDALAVRVMRSSHGASDREQCQLAWRLALGRDPTTSELALTENHLATQTAHFARQTPALDARRAALASLCQVLLGTNEFVYVD